MGVRTRCRIILVRHFTITTGGELMNPIEMFENPAMAEQRRINQLLVEQQQFWFPFNAHPPSNDAERQEAIQALMHRYGQLSVLQGDAMFLNAQGYGRLLSLVQQQLNAILSARNQYVSSLQGNRYTQNPGYQTPRAPTATPSRPTDRPTDVAVWLAQSSADQQRARDRMVGDCIHCHRPLEGNSKCPYCGRYQNIS
jgi:hypothetical protein